MPLLLSNDAAQLGEVNKGKGRMKNYNEKSQI